VQKRVVQKLCREYEQTKALKFKLLQTPPATSSLLAIIDPEVVAQQLTLMEWELFFSLQSDDVINHTLKTASKTSSIRRLLKHFNHVQTWVCRQILLPEKLKRVEMMSFMINIANHLRKFCNFSTLMCFMQAMETAPIYRLQKTKKKIKPFYHSGV